MRYKCIAFDFDGTLADTEEMTFRIYNDIACKYKLAPIDREDLRKLKRLQVQEILELVNIPLHKVPKLIKQGQKRMREMKDQVKPFDPALSEKLNSIRKNVQYCGIITSNSKKVVRAFLQNQHLAEDIDFLVNARLHTKDEKLQKIMEKYKLKAEEMLYVGDETRDIQACQKAGIDIIAVKWGYNAPEALEAMKPTYLADSFDDIITVVERNNAEDRDDEKIN